MAGLRPQRCPPRAEPCLCSRCCPAGAFCPGCYWRLEKKERGDPLPPFQLPQNPWSDACLPGQRGDHRALCLDLSRLAWEAWDSGASSLTPGPQLFSANSSIALGSSAACLQKVGSHLVRGHRPPLSLWSLDPVSSCPPGPLAVGDGHPPGIAATWRLRLAEPSHGARPLGAHAGSSEANTPLRPHPGVSGQRRSTASSPTCPPASWLRRWDPSERDGQVPGLNSHPGTLRKPSPSRTRRCRPLAPPAPLLTASGEQTTCFGAQPHFRAEVRPRPPFLDEGDHHILSSVFVLRSCLGTRNKARGVEAGRGRAVCVCVSGSGWLPPSHLPGQLRGAHLCARISSQRLCCVVCVSGSWRLVEVLGGVPSQSP